MVPPSSCRLGMAMAGKMELTPAEWWRRWRPRWRAIMARGKAQRGEKTMVDALDAGHRCAQGSAVATAKISLLRCARSVAAAEAGYEGTIPMLATKGRASLSGRAQHWPPGSGATSVVSILLRCCHDTIESITSKLQIADCRFAALTTADLQSAIRTISQSDKEVTTMAKYAAASTRAQPAPAS